MAPMPFAALTYQGGAAWRARLQADLGDRPDVARLIDAQTGDLPDLYRTYRLDSEAIIDAAAELSMDIEGRAK